MSAFSLHSLWEKRIIQRYIILNPKLEASQHLKKIITRLNFVMEVISNRKELIEFYLRRGYINTNLYLDFPKSSLWNELSNDLKLLVLKKWNDDLNL